MKKYFVTGLIILFPLAVTLAVLRFLIVFFTKPFAGFTSHLIQKWNLFPNGLFVFTQDQAVQYVSRVFILLALVAFTLLLGLVTRWFFMNSLVYVLGLIATDSPDSCNQATNKNLISVLVPTAPNPTTGFLLMVPKEDLIFLEMKAEDAIKYIVSCGVILPKEKSAEAL
jgi:uncharacterized membrane protein